MAIEKAFLYLPVYSVGLSIGLTIASPVLTPVLAEFQSDRVQLSQNSLRDRVQVFFEPPPGRDAPTNTVAGGTRNSGCGNYSGISMTPLLPKTKWGLTMASHPTWLVYVPQTNCRYAEFVLLDLEEEDETVVYQTSFEVSNAPGIVKLELPSDEPPLEIGKNYIWFLSLTLDSSSADDPGLTLVSGSLERVARDDELTQKLKNASPLEQAALYGKEGIWYETIAILADLLKTQPDLKMQWEALLSSETVGLSAVAEEPLVECCQLEDDLQE